MAETPQERAETARVRRRLLNLGEILAVLAVVISGLTLWNSYSERKTSEAEHKQEQVQSARKASLLVLKASADDGGKRLTLSPRAEAQAIQSQTIRFPAALALSPAETSGDPRIERGWFDNALARAIDAAGSKEKATGDARLPVLIETSYLVDGEPQMDRAVYEIGYAADHGLLGGTSIKLRGLSRVGPAGSVAAGQKRIDTLFAGRTPAKK